MIRKRNRVISAITAFILAVTFINVNFSSFKVYAEQNNTNQIKGIFISGEKSEFVKEKYGYTDLTEIKEDNAFAQWQFNVEQDGNYNLNFEYYTLNGKGFDIEYIILLDNENTDENTQTYILKRQWKDANIIKQDNKGNDIRPDTQEVFGWQKAENFNSDGTDQNQKTFSLKAGTHKIKLVSVQGAFAVANIFLNSVEKLDTYQEYLNKYKGKETKGEKRKIQAENYFKKSDESIVSNTDNTNPSVEPNDPVKLRLNTLGGYNWRYSGQWISWEIEAPKDGLYNISFKARQNTVTDMNSTRTLYIDEGIPFLEAKNLKFPYANNWYTYIAGGKENPYLFYLTKGTHELKLKVVLGDVSQTVKNCTKIADDIGLIYRKLIMVMGTTPDINREYFLDVEIPDLIPNLQKISKALKEEAKAIENYSNNKKSGASQLYQIAVNMDMLVKKPYTISNNMEKIRSDASSLTSWLLKLKEQPLEFDYIELISPDKEPDKANGTLIKEFLFGLEAFIATFFDSYNNIKGSDKDETVKVWMSSGRDQAEVLEKIISSSYDKADKIKLEVVPNSSIIQATLANKGPDAVLYAPKNMPVDFALRGAAVNLEKFNGFDEIKKQFYDSAFIPYRFNNGTYALPETQTFMMFFYRTDIFKDLKINQPNTISEFYNVIKVVQKNNMDVGIPSEFNMAGATGVNEQIFQMFLFQNGLSYFDEQQKNTMFASSEVLNSFIEWTELFTKYSTPLYYDFYNRFRTGEVPCGYADYTMYGMLKMAAPEINNKWQMIPVPGTIEKDGKMNRSIGASGTAAIVLTSSKKQEAAFDFIKWWVSEKTQGEYGLRLEGLLGPSARYPTANKLAFLKIPWTNKETKILEEQWQYVSDIVQVPGSYYISRCLANAFRKVVYYNANERETLFDYNNQINEEMKRKREEFNLN